VCPPVHDGSEGGGFSKKFSRRSGVHALVVDVGGGLKVIFVRAMTKEAKKIARKEEGKGSAKGAMV